MFYVRPCKGMSVSRHPTRWAWNSPTKYPSFTVIFEDSPSHPVGSEPPKERNKALVLYSLSPSHTVGSEQGSWQTLNTSSTLSPSHTVGLEHSKKQDKNETRQESPSHIVGSERSYTHFVNAYFMLSPSHTVGLEPFTNSGLHHFYLL